MFTPTRSSSAPLEPSQPREKTKLKVTIVRATGLPKVDGLNCTRKVDGGFYGVVTIDEERQETKVARRSSAPEWNQLFFFDTHPSSTLKIEIFARRIMSKDQRVGFISELISIICPSVLDGSPQDVTKIISGESGARIVLRLECEAVVDIMRALPVTEISSTMSTSLTPPEVLQDVPTDTISEKIVDLKRGFSQMHSLPEPISTIVEGAKSVPSKANDFVATWQPLFDNIKIFGDLMASLAEVHPYAKIAWSILSLPLKIVQNQMERDKNILKLFETMQSLYSIVDVLEKELKDKRGKIESQQGLFKCIAQQTTECYYFIREYVKTEGFAKRIAKHAISSTDDTIDAFCKVFVELEKAFHTGMAVQTEIVTIRILDKVEHILDGVEHILDHTEMIRIESDLKEIKYTGGAGFNKKKGCQSGTRVKILGEIRDWIISEDPRRVLLLTGVAGTGKSAIAHSIAHHFKGLNRLGSSFCFTRNEAGRGPDKLFPNVARDLADFDECIQRALWGVVYRHTALRTTSNIDEHFEHLILEPIKKLTLTGPLVIVIDALDESGDVQSRQGLLELLAERTADLPSNVRILLTSRPETDIEKLFQPNDHVLIKRMQDLASSTEADISLYIDSRLGEFNVHGIDKECRKSLVAKCEGLFQWASIACEFVKGLGLSGLTHRERFDLIVQGKTNNGWPLDPLYRTVLSHIFQSEDSGVMYRFRLVMSLVLTTCEPLSIKALDEILRAANNGERDFRTSIILEHMGSLLSGVTGLDAVRPLHTSFRDFLLDRSRSGNFYINTFNAHTELTAASLYILKTQLTFNMCNLESSHVANKDIPSLADRIKECIPAHLSYSCRFWVYHLHASLGSDPKLLEDVAVVLRDKLLFWLEAMSLLGAIPGAAQATSSLVKWSSSLNIGQIPKLASGAHAFVNAFGLPMSQSTPHVYLSGIAFAPQRSTVFKRFGKDFPRALKVSAGADDYWPAAQHIIHTGSRVQCVAILPNGSWIMSGFNEIAIRAWDMSTGEAVGDSLEGHTSVITSIACSPDGSRMVSGSRDKTIRMWDVATHAAVGSPLEGHTGTVNSVAFSRDGSWIVSGSDDKTIRVWDATTGAAMENPLEGHTDRVRSVAFSPDGSWIVSGSDDATIKVWDTATGAAVGDPLEGHTDWIRCVAFSRDGSQIVSGSDDKTIRVWDTVTHAAVGDPLEGHTRPVASVAFSPDGKLIVSGSWDKTIRVWSVVTCATVGNPLEGHTGPVTSVALTTDGKRIVSGSDDKTIRVWDAEIRAAVGNPLEGHTDPVSSAAFSPDGLWIVSGSSTKTIRVWDAATSAVVGDLLEGHMGSVTSVAFSPDGSRIASSSFDETIRVWDAATFTAVGSPLKGHTNLVTSVAFSPDGRRIVSGSLDSTIRVWDVATCAPVGNPLKEHTSWVASVAFSPDGKWIVSGSRDNTIRVWDVATHVVVGNPLEGHTGWVTSVAFSPDGKLIVSGSSDNTIRLWDATTQAAVGNPLKGHSIRVTSVAFSPDGKQIVSGSDDSTIRVWEVATRAALGNPLEGHTRGVQSVAFSQDGSRIVSGSDDCTIRVWDAPIVHPISTNEVDSLPVPLRSVTSNTPPTSQSELSGMRPNSILISSRLEHAMRTYDVYESATPLPWDCRTSQHIDADGWIVGPASELLFWVPAAYRNKLWPDSRLKIVIGREYSQLDLSQFVHGTSWHECYCPARP